MTRFIGPMLLAIEIGLLVILYWLIARRQKRQLRELAEFDRRLRAQRDVERAEKYNTFPDHIRPDGTGVTRRPLADVKDTGTDAPPGAQVARPFHRRNGTSREG